jgi:hypothetical protein
VEFLASVFNPLLPVLCSAGILFWRTYTFWRVEWKKQSFSVMGMWWLKRHPRSAAEGGERTLV